MSSLPFVLLDDVFNHYPITRIRVDHVSLVSNSLLILEPFHWLLRATKDVHAEFDTCNRNRKLRISRASTKAKSQEPAYSQVLNQSKIDRQRSRSREPVRQTVRRLWRMVLGVETGREVWAN